MPGEQILNIEDNVKNLKLVRDVLQFHGYSILEAETGEAGIALAREQRPALILMDIQLPGMDGRAALKALKADTNTQHIPIIALTAFAMKGDRESLQTEGFDDYMAKPIDIKELPRVVERHLRGRL
jgi:two-component system cell cycle response regulator DivK